ncbi:MAG: hypothetical protein ABIQ12_05425 [Opitutaceae bacterium]
MLPALQAVLHILVGLGFVRRRRAGAAGSRSQLSFKRIEQWRDVVVKLRAGERTHRGLGRVRLGRLAPSRQNCAAPGRQMRTQSGQLFESFFGHEIELLRGGCEWGVQTLNETRLVRSKFFRAEGSNALILW